MYQVHVHILEFSGSYIYLAQPKPDQTNKKLSYISLQVYLMSSSTLESVCWLVLGCYIIFFFSTPFHTILPGQVPDLTGGSEIVIWEFLFPKFPKLSWFEVDLHSLSFSLPPSSSFNLYYSSSSDSHIGTYLPTRINRSVMVQCQVRSGKVQVPDR